MNMNDIFSLKGRVALVTGGSRGIGKMIAEGYIAQGAKVYISSRSQQACDETVAELGSNCIALPADISTIAGCEALVSLLAEKEQSLDILVNNAGATWGAEFADFPEAGWDKVMDLNVKTPFFLTQKLFPMLKASGTPQSPAKVINIGSIDGMRISQWETYSYQASKAAILYLTKRMAARLVTDHINVTAIAPGAFPTKLNRVALDQAENVAKAIPSKRVGYDEDMAAAAIYLAARSGDYVVGHTLTVDGGLVNAELGVNIIE
ncbi:MAG: 3-oxoacyl-ACP reductase [Hyphomicrobiales bacterium]|nr:MAG: 3-oxoacyl-ACP reductase [Hyphomicrobiales bacterium]